MLVIFLVDDSSALISSGFLTNFCIQGFLYFPCTGLASWTIHVFIFSLSGKAHVYILWFCLLKPQLHL
ncbi:hypothetical protein BHE74_00054616 [Ensete ventricosum]|nr:hypothetical protein BHE74_00054616 [Ensete ventricosum]